MIDNELIEWGIPGNKHSNRSAGSSPGTADLLPRAGDSPGIAGQDTCFKAADIDSEFKCVGTDNAEYFFMSQLPFYFPSGLRKITSSISANWNPMSRMSPQCVLKVLEEDFDIDSAAGKNQSLDFFS